MNQIDNPKLFVMVGLPCSGKSTKSQELAKEYDATIFSSDALREELFGDVNEQSRDQELFTELHRRIKECLKNGKSAIYDACNRNYKKRMAFLSELKNIPCKKICILMATPYEDCIERSKIRERKVPEHVIKRMYTGFNIPYWYEGWDDIRVIGWQSPFFNVDYEVSKLEKYDQGNSHHALTLGDHLWKAYYYYFDKYRSFDHRDDASSIATVLHDISKPFCRTTINSRGIDDGEVHYYNHQYVSAYDSLFIKSLHNRLDVAIRIMWHMQPYFWEKDNNEKMHDKYRKLWGEELYCDIMQIHEADKHAH